MKNITKKYKAGYIIFSVLSVLILLTPLLVYTFIGLATAEVVDKLVLSMTVVTAAILTLISLVTKHASRSAIFVVLLGLTVALNSIQECLVLIAIANILDELILTPLKVSFKNKYQINKEIDKRYD